MKFELAHSQILKRALVGAVAIIAILVLVLLVAFFLFKGGIFGGRSVPEKIDVNISK